MHCFLHHGCRLAFDILLFVMRSLPEQAADIVQSFLGDEVEQHKRSSPPPPVALLMDCDQLSWEVVVGGARRVPRCPVKEWIVDSGVACDVVGQDDIE